MDVSSRWPVNSTITDTAAVHAAIAWARRLPPSSLASRPVRSTVSAAASADGSRSTVNESGAMLAHSACDQRGQRSLVGIGPIEVLAGGEEVELVAVISVARRERDQRNEHRAGGERNRATYYPGRSHTTTAA